MAGQQRRTTMDARRAPAYQWLSLLLATLLADGALGIVGRDTLVLTPRQDLAVGGRSLYYVDSAIAAGHSEYPWARTLKHVTYVTLFANAAGVPSAGNVSQPMDYGEFLQSPYIVQAPRPDARFGDIVTLAQGRVEAAANGRYRFVEGKCNWGVDVCAAHARALWQVQRIRHRDASGGFRYEIKFSVSPMPGHGGHAADARRWPPQQRSDVPPRTFVQRADDYPQSFDRLMPSPAATVTDKQSAVKGKPADGSAATMAAAGRGGGNATRNFRQIHAADSPLPQSTFMHGIFRAPPLLPPAMGQRHPPLAVEYLGSGGAPPVNGGLFPNLFNSRLHFPATTYRPLDVPKLPQSAMNILEPADMPEDSSHTQPAAAPLVTHHFHHHFYMLGSGENGLAATGSERHAPARVPHALQYREPMAPQQESTYATDGHAGFGGSHFAATPLTPHRVHFPTAYEQPPGRRGQVAALPRLSTARPVHGAGAKAPLLIYTAPSDEEIHARPLPSTRPFTQSEPYNETPIRYSEPDPLYFTAVDDVGRVAQQLANADAQETPMAPGFAPERDPSASDKEEQDGSMPSSLEELPDELNDEQQETAPADIAKSTAPQSTGTQQVRKHIVVAVAAGAISGADRITQTPLRAIGHSSRTNSTETPRPERTMVGPEGTASGVKPVYEVLTQRSVSKSVSIKVGSNGQEMPIVVADDGNSDDGSDGDYKIISSTSLN